MYILCLHNHKREKKGEWRWNGEKRRKERGEKRKAEMREWMTREERENKIRRGEDKREISNNINPYTKV